MPLTPSARSRKRLSGRAGVAVLVQAACLLMVLSACSTQPSPLETLIEARGRLVSEIQQCSNRYDYNPRTASAISQNALAPHEPEWHSCVYAAIRSYENINLQLAPLYNSLIDEDIVMTNAIAHGQMTRSERRTRINQILAEIKTAEENQIIQAKLQQAERNRAMRNVIDMIRTLSDLSTLPPRHH